MHIIVFLCAYMHKTRSETEVSEQFFFYECRALKTTEFSYSVSKKTAREHKNRFKSFNTDYYMSAPHGKAAKIEIM